MVQLAEEGYVPAAEMLPAADYIYQNALLLNAFKTYPILSAFDGLAHNRIRESFANLDAEITRSTAIEIARKLLQAKAPPGRRDTAANDSNLKEATADRRGKVANYTDMVLIRHIISHPKTRMKVRQIVHNAHRALQALKPCFMMSPLSVAQYLPANVSFDLVVIDEASQLKVEEALGAIARGSQVVIVGDLHQLPPSNFFQKKLRGEEQETEDDRVAEECESILELASALYDPPRTLNWHYRSRHQDLIAFSNRKFYGDRLVVFPSPFPANAERGVEFVYVRDGIYEDQQNEAEADRVVEDAIKHLLEYPEASLGIVVMNQKQQELIEERLEEVLKNNELARQVRDRWDERKGEEVFVKNLETVQGDERDVIFISVNIGKDKDGDLPLTRLSLLNRASGYRRLNVLVTRAKNRTVVYSSFQPEDLRVSDNSKYGARMLKEYLVYARNVTNRNYSSDNGALCPGTDFQIAVCDALNKRGYQAVPRIGVESYWIDVAVVHPDRTDRKDQFILGIESDGALYHASRSARDRDRLRQQVLTGLGWNLHRIWSADWFRNSEMEIEKIVRRIEQLRLANDTARR